MVIGYLLIGMAIITYCHLTLFWVRSLNLFSEIGIIPLLLVVGMDFPLEKHKIWKKAFTMSLSESLLTFVIGYLFF